MFYFNNHNLKMRKLLGAMIQTILKSLTLLRHFMGKLIYAYSNRIKQKS